MVFFGGDRYVKISGMVVCSRISGARRWRFRRSCCRFRPCWRIPIPTIPWCRRLLRPHGDWWEHLMVKHQPWLMDIDGILKILMHIDAFFGGWLWLVEEWASWIDSYWFILIPRDPFARSKGWSCQETHHDTSFLRSIVLFRSFQYVSTFAVRTSTQWEPLDELSITFRTSLTVTNLRISVTSHTSLWRWPEI